MTEGFLSPYIYPFKQQAMFRFNAPILIVVIFITTGCIPKTIPPSSDRGDLLPDTFRTRFVTTRGEFYAEFYRELSPLAVQRAHDLLESGFFNDIAIFRVEPDYVVQFGISDSTALNEYWKSQSLPDEKNKGANTAGTIAFARGGKDSRTTQLFINMQDNRKLDDLDFNGVRGFPVIGKVYKGMETVRRFYPGYAFEPAARQDSIWMYGNDYLRKNYPKLDFIIKAEILKE